jgi:2-succinyl-6-hydroxy-2,4-cyclohexadiene-1-carboxylate synthase
MMLAADVDEEHLESADALDTVWLHGFTQTARSWRPLLSVPTLRNLTPRRLRIDLPGHGDSPVASGDLWNAARQVIDTTIGHRFTRSVLVGYSMGGRIALHAALIRPDLWSGVILIGATPGLADLATRRMRRQSDERLSHRIGHIGVDAFLAEWLAQPMFARLPPRPDDLTERRRNTPEGLASSLVHCGTGTQDDLRWRLGELTMPALILAGALDPAFVTVGRELADLWGGEARFTEVPQAGHAAHLEQPTATADLVAAWLDELT